ncbi:phosphonatase-like hydrolase [Tenacibaculum dicentrarchi]|nr:phosphonatase-like hydrolase [Tenacibaculum dicentrarchi]MCD8414940.1 phosphonatase-like hydrolase [Tenacibaculum dicentrarchi]MCD8420064.1 phosphonatase-like hydrolase [Tenacibaculum dicentrarchi]MCD8437522.1 phosphonatase-like hydrolase [Tenacibaculum dicentrarchi]MCD8449587.1 phosphonatase-like hydrolase [Tenacibaculum dicentrarchi]
MMMSETKRKIEMVVFDMAGTTVDEQNVVYKTLHKAIQNFNVEVSLETVLEYGAGKEKHKAIKDVLTHLKSDKLKDSQTIFDNFKKSLAVAYEFLEVKPIKGVEKVLLNLRSEGVKVVLNTGYDRKTATLLLDKLQWDEKIHYDALITASDVVNGRPHPDMIFQAMELFGITDASKVLKAGDSAIDIEEGKNAGCGITVGVLSGAQTKVQLEKQKPTYVLESLVNLKDTFKVI